MKTLHAILLIVACMIAAPGPAGWAQTVDDASHVRDYITRNAEMIEKAKELVGRTNSVRARQALDAAVALHQQSVSVLNAAATSRDVRRAAALAQKARELILQTIAIAKREAKLEESAVQAIERAGERFERARALRTEGTDAELATVDQLLRESHDLLQRARDNVREHLYEVALKLAVSSEELSDRAIRIMRRDSPDIDMVERELEKTDRLLERVRDQLGNNDSPSARLLGEAADLQRRAHDTYRQGQPGAALELSRQARRIGMRAAKLYTTQPNDDNVARAVRLTDALLEEARVIAQDREADRLDDRIDQAAGIQDRAKRQLAGGNYDGALKLTREARDLLKDALGAIKSDLSRDDVEPTLRGTDRLLRRLKDVLDDADDDFAKDLYDRSRKKQRQAWSEFKDGRLRAALADTRLARQLANQAFRQIGYEM